MSGWKGKGKSFLWGVLAGGVAGIIGGLLFAPKAGRELRQDLQEQCREWGDKTQDMIAFVSEKAKEAAESVSGHTEELLGKVQAMANRMTREIGGRQTTASSADSVESGKEPLTAATSGFRAE